MATAMSPMLDRKSWLRRQFRHVAGFVRGMPTALKILLGLFAVVAFGLAGYYLVERRARHNAFVAERDAWRQFDEAVRSGDYDEMDAALGEVLLAKPGDPTATARRVALASGKSAENDPQMPRLTLRKALRENDPVAAKREAEKLLVHAPNDWLARLTVAQAVLAAGDRDAAVAELDKLPTPEAAGTGIYPGVTMFAFDLFRRLGRDTTPLRQFIQTHYARYLKSETVKNLPPNERLGIVECYLLGFEPGEVPQPASLLESFAAARDLVASAAADAEATSVVTHAARMGPALELAARRLADRGQITAQQRDDFVADDAERGVRLWNEILTRDPQSPEAYRNLAALAARQGDGAKALGFLKRGLQACPDDAALAEIQDHVLRSQGRGLESARRLAEEARRRPQSATWWRIAVEAARLAGRADLAIELLAESRQLRPGEPWTVLAETELRLNAGDAKAAAASLRTLGTERLAGENGALRLAARTFAEAGETSELTALTAAADARAQKFGMSEPLTSLIGGLLDAPLNQGRATDAAARSEAALRRFPGDPELLKRLALAQFQRAELANWGRDEVTRAVGAATRYRASAFGDRDVAFWLGALRLYGEDRAQQALRDLETIRANETEATASELAVIGEALRRSGQTDPALRLLGLAVSKPRPSAGVFIQLALARQAAGDVPQAKEALAQAQRLPRTPREQADYAAAARMLY